MQNSDPNKTFRFIRSDLKEVSNWSTSQKNYGDDKFDTVIFISSSTDRASGMDTNSGARNCGTFMCAQKPVHTYFHSPLFVSIRLTRTVDERIKMAVSTSSVYLQLRMICRSHRPFFVFVCASFRYIFLMGKIAISHRPRAHWVALYLAGYIFHWNCLSIIITIWK